MPTQIRLPPYQLADLQVIRDAGPELLLQMIAALEKFEPRPVPPTTLHQELRKELRDQKEIADCLFRQLLSLYGLVRQRGLRPEQILEGIRFGIETAEEPWSNEGMEKWWQVEPLLEKLLFLPIVRLVATTLDLSYEYANLLQRTRIITDIRPIFNLDATEIEGAVVTHTLRIRYDSVDGDHGLSIAMDENDVKTLLDQCNRALVKAQTAKRRMEQKGNIPTIISGEKGNEAE